MRSVRSPEFDTEAEAREWADDLHARLHQGYGVYLHVRGTVGGKWVATGSMGSSAD